MSETQALPEALAEPTVRVRPGWMSLLFFANIALWLDCGYVHADLSSYNLLWDDPRIVAIDFPQSVDAYDNPHAFDFLRRDVANVCKHFGRYGVSVDAESLAWDLWEGKVLALASPSRA